MDIVGMIQRVSFWMAGSRLWKVGKWVDIIDSETSISINY